MKLHVTTGFELARVHAFAVAAVHRCVRQHAIGPVLALATALDALGLTLERGFSTRDAPHDDRQTAQLRPRPQRTFHIDTSPRLRGFVQTRFGEAITAAIPSRVPTLLQTATASAKYQRPRRGILRGVAVTADGVDVAAEDREVQDLGRDRDYDQKDDQRIRNQRIAVYRQEAAVRELEQRRLEE